MPDAPHILIVEDDAFVGALIAAYLEKGGYRLSRADSVKAMHERLAAGAVDLIVLDLGLPDEDGLAALRQLRTRSQLPIIVLTARRGRDDRIAALGLGADDYVTKPVDPEELALRVANMLRRAHGEASAANQDAAIEFAGWRLDVAANVLRAPDGKKVDLTRAEFDVLTALARARGRVLSRDFLLDAMSRDGDAPGDRVVDVMVSRLRKKMRDDPRSPHLIQTVPGRGYKLAAT